MSNSKYSQIEHSNNERLEELANKLTIFRNINQDIGNQANEDNSFILEIQHSFEHLSSNIKNSSLRLTRSMNAGSNMWRMIILTLVVFFIGYTLFKIV